MSKKPEQDPERKITDLDERFQNFKEVFDERDKRIETQLKWSEHLVHVITIAYRTAAVITVVLAIAVSVYIKDPIVLIQQMKDSALQGQQHLEKLSEAWSGNRKVTLFRLMFDLEAVMNKLSTDITDADRYFVDANCSYIVSICASILSQPLLLPKDISKELRKMKEGEFVAETKILEQMQKMAEFTPVLSSLYLTKAQSPQKDVILEQIKQWSEITHSLDAIITEDPPIARRLATLKAFAWNGLGILRIRQFSIDRHPDILYKAQDSLSKSIASDKTIARAHINTAVTYIRLYSLPNYAQTNSNAIDKAEQFLFDAIGVTGDKRALSTVYNNLAHIELLRASNAASKGNTNETLTALKKAEDNILQSFRSGPAAHPVAYFTWAEVLAKKLAFENIADWTPAKKAQIFSTIIGKIRTSRERGYDIGNVTNLYIENPSLTNLYFISTNYEALVLEKLADP